MSESSPFFDDDDDGRQRQRHRRRPPLPSPFPSPSFPADNSNNDDRSLSLEKLLSEAAAWEVAAEREARERERRVAAEAEAEIAAEEEEERARGGGVRFARSRLFRGTSVLAPSPATPTSSPSFYDGGRRPGSRNAAAPVPTLQQQLENDVAANGDAGDDDVASWARSGRSGGSWKREERAFLPPPASPLDPRARLASRLAGAASFECVIRSQRQRMEEEGRRFAEERTRWEQEKWRRRMRMSQRREEEYEEETRRSTTTTASSSSFYSALECWEDW